LTKDDIEITLIIFGVIIYTAEKSQISKFSQNCIYIIGFEFYIQEKEEIC